MSTLLHEDRPVARKPHTCDACLLTIAPGTRYLHQRCAADGRAYHYRSHIACHDLVIEWAIEWNLADDDPIDVSELRAELAARADRTEATR